MKFRYGRAIGLTTAVIAFFLPVLLWSQSTTIQTEQLIRASDVIVVGRVGALKSEWNADKSRIQTVVKIQVGETIKGAVDGGSLTVVIPGGEVDGVGEWYSHSVRFKDSEDVVVFAKKDKQGGHARDRRRARKVPRERGEEGRLEDHPERRGPRGFHRAGEKDGAGPGDDPVGSVGEPIRRRDALRHSMSPNFGFHHQSAFIEGSAMKKLIAFLFALLLIVPAAALGQTNVVLLPYGSGGYKYQFVKSNSSTITSGVFYTNGWNESGCSSNGFAAFGTLNNTSSPPCPLNDATHIKTIWPSSKDLIVRKRVTVPAGAQNVRVKVAIDNGVSVWWNGTNISGGIKSSNDCATEDGDFIFTVPAALVMAGENILTARGVWMSQKNYLDMQVLCDLSFTITASAGANGSISPSGAVNVPSGTNKAFNITANPGYHVASITVDGVTTNVETSTSTPVDVRRTPSRR